MPNPAGSLFMRRAGWARSQGTMLAASYWFRLRMCFWGDAHAGVSCRVQLGAPPRPGFAAGWGLVVGMPSAGALAFYTAGEFGDGAHILCSQLLSWRKDGLRRCLHGGRDARAPRARSQVSGRGGGRWGRRCIWAGGHSRLPRSLRPLPVRYRFAEA